MAFDAGMLAAVSTELSALVGYRIEKIHQPEQDELLFLLHGMRETQRLLISCGANYPRIHLTTQIKENPQVPPMFCMQLRRHLSGAKLLSVTQQGFDRVLDLAFEIRDEMGYPATRHLMVEIMGKCSNTIFCDEQYKILGVLKLVDFTTSRKRQVLPGMRYELPPATTRIDPRTETHDAFLSALATCDKPLDKWFLSRYDGLSPLIVRELCHSGTDAAALWQAFSALSARLTDSDYTLTMLTGADGTPLEYAYLPILQYGDAATQTTFPTTGALLDAFYGARAARAHMKSRAADITHILDAATARLVRKIALQEGELAACTEKEQHKRYGDLITYNTYQIQRGMTSARLPDYTEDPPALVTVPLDVRLSPSQNAQRYYKRYAKAKTAEQILTSQIALARAELSYLETVAEALARAENEADLADLRAELAAGGYTGKTHAAKQQKRPPTKPMVFETTNGYRVLCGKNNLQNDALTTKQAGKTDWWFHTKNNHGAHVILFAEDTEPPEADFTDAAMIAAYYSEARDGAQVPVDYAQARYVKKPAGAKPGFVIYTHNFTAFVTPDAAHIENMRKKS